MQAIKNFWFRLTRSFKIVKFYWNKPDYDWTSVSSLMRFQLTRLEKNIANGYHSNQDRDSKNIKIAIELLKRLEDDVAWDMAARRYPIFNFDKINGMSIRPRDVKMGGILSLNTHPTNSRFWGQAIKENEVMYEDLLWGIFRKHFRGWWD